MPSIFFILELCNLSFTTPPTMDNLTLSARIHILKLIADIRALNPSEEIERVLAEREGELVCTPDQWTSEWCALRDDISHECGGRMSLVRECVREGRHERFGDHIRFLLTGPVFTRFECSTYNDRLYYVLGVREATSYDMEESDEGVLKYEFDDGLGLTMWVGKRYMWLRVRKDEDDD